ncbi:MAG: glycosyl hydrolase [Ardenticatenaceae bacterium]|nr:glycosyl hydrolase [Ardenticatenaceae bacterium]HBY97446.1 hypothetical protein [Chloroflexota bacterium]
MIGTRRRLILASVVFALVLISFQLRTRADDPLPATPTTAVPPTESPPPAETPTVTEATEASARPPIVLGVHIPPRVMDYENDISYFEQQAGRELGYLWYYQAWDNGFDPYLPQRLERLSTPPVIMITWEPFLSPNKARPAENLQNIVDGVYDDYIRQFARGIKSRPKEIYLIRFGHEMNLAETPWGGAQSYNGNDPSRYVKAYRRIRQIFREEGVTNTQFVWSPNVKSWPPDPWNHWSNYYPGDDVVDWIGVSAFNWGTGSIHGGWTSFNDLLGSFLTEVSCRYAKPVMLAEIGSVNERKPEWLNGMFQTLSSNYPNVRALSFYNVYATDYPGKPDFRVIMNRSRPLPLDAAVTDAYRRGIADPTRFISTMPSLSQLQVQRQCPTVQLQKDSVMLDMFTTAFPVSLDPAAGAGSTVQLGLEGFPPGTSAWFAPTVTLDGNNRTTWLHLNQRGAAPGHYTAYVTAGGVSRVPLRLYVPQRAYRQFMPLLVRNQQRTRAYP